MKKKLKYILILFIFSYQCITSQTVQTSGALINVVRYTSNYRPAKIEFNNGTEKNGFITGFIENNNIEIANFRFLSNFEHQLNLDDEKFRFKTSEDEKPEKISQQDIKSITVNIADEKKVKTYYLMDIYAIDKKSKNLESLNRKAWLPKIFEGKTTNIYGFNLFKDNQYISTYFYMNIEGNKAIRYFDDGMISCGKICIQEYYKSYYYEIFVKKCEEMKPIIDDFLLNEMTKEKGKELLYKRFEDLKKIKKDKNLSKEEKKELSTQVNQNMILNRQINLILEQEKLCK